jgi:hypothetical protein
VESVQGLDDFETVNFIAVSIRVEAVLFLRFIIKM